MTKLQIFSIVISIVLFFTLYLGCDTKPKGQQTIEQSRAFVAQSLDIEKLIEDSKAPLDKSTQTAILALEQEVQIGTDSSDVEAYKQLSSVWYKNGQLAVAGHYAEQVAALLNTEQAWSIAGTTYSLCLQKNTNDREKDFCTNQAVKAYENAISIAPNNMNHKLNLALVYVDNPPKSNPMQGIKMLLDLNKKEPENIAVLTNLGRLSIRTGQYEKAKERLEKAYTLVSEENNRTIVCLLAQVYEALDDANRSVEFAEKCTAFTGR